MPVNPSVIFIHKNYSSLFDLACNAVSVKILGSFKNLFAGNKKKKKITNLFNYISIKLDFKNLNTFSILHLNCWFQNISDSL